jgi:hypothetical protein
MKVRTQCLCRAFIECEQDELSVAHALTAHEQTPQHRQYVDRLLAKFIEPRQQEIRA